MKTIQNKTKQPILLPVLEEKIVERPIKRIVDDQVVVASLKVKKAVQVGVYYFPERMGEDASKYTVQMTDDEFKKFEKMQPFANLMGSPNSPLTLLSETGKVDAYEKAYHPTTSPQDPYTAKPKD